MNNERKIRKDENTEEKFWLRVSIGKPDECWLWKGAPLNTGYCLVRISGVRKYAHRASYEYTHGEIPKGLVIDHICRVRSCVNPSHLRAVTPKQNSENMSHQKRNKLRVRGVRKKGSAFEVWVGHYGKQAYCGRYSTLEEAEKVSVETRNLLYTHNELDKGYSDDR